MCFTIFLFNITHLLAFPLSWLLFMSCTLVLHVLNNKALNQIKNYHRISFISKGQLLKPEVYFESFRSVSRGSRPPSPSPSWRSCCSAETPPCCSVSSPLTFDAARRLSRAHAAAVTLYGSGSGCRCSLGAAQSRSDESTA